MIFMAGETIDLCVPTEGDFEQWASWFNDKNITRYLDHGVFPNSTEDQKKFYENAKTAGRLITLIKNKSGKLLGVTSLSEINYAKRSCQISNVTPIKSKDALLAPLEARSMLVKHAIEVLGMERIWAGNCFPELIDWVLKYQCLGFRVEGFSFKNFRKGTIVGDSINLCLLKSDYEALKAKRGGDLWLGSSNMLSLVKSVKNKRMELEDLYKSVKNFQLIES